MVRGSVRLLSVVHDGRRHRRAVVRCSASQSARRGGGARARRLRASADLVAHERAWSRPARYHRSVADRRHRRRRSAQPHSRRICKRVTSTRERGARRVRREASRSARADRRRLEHRVGHRRLPRRRRRVEASPAGRTARLPRVPITRDDATGRAACSVGRTLLRRNRTPDITRSRACTERVDWSVPLRRTSTDCTRAPGTTASSSCTDASQT